MNYSGIALIASLFLLLSPASFAEDPRKWQAEAAISPEVKKVLAKYRKDGHTTEVLCNLDFETGPLSSLEPKRRR